MTEYAKEIISELIKPPLNMMPALTKKFLLGKFFGTIYDVSWNDGTEGKVMAFDFENSVHRLTEKEHVYKSKRLYKQLMKFNMFDKNIEARV